MAELAQRFAPEVMYGAADGRTLTFVADLPTALEIAVFMEICSDRLYAYPRLRPVIGVEEMPDFVAKVHELVGNPKHRGGSGLGGRAARRRDFKHPHLRRQLDRLRRAS